MAKGKPLDLLGDFVCNARAYLAAALDLYHADRPLRLI